MRPDLYLDRASVHSSVLPALVPCCAGTATTHRLRAARTRGCCVAWPCVLPCVRETAGAACRQARVVDASPFFFLRRLVVPRRRRWLGGSSLTSIISTAGGRSWHAGVERRVARRADVAVQPPRVGVRNDNDDNGAVGLVVCRA